MPRQPRLIIPGVAMHVIQRGNNRAPCFLAASDYLLYVALLRDLARKTQCAVHAYCLMTNHVHVLLTPATESGCADLMRDLGQRYVRYFNSRYGRTGTLWEGRFRSCIAESAAYVLACYRYIELNPVRAGMVAHPGGYAWSSYAANTGMRGDPLISEHPEFAALAEDMVARQRAYRDMVGAGLAADVLEEIRDATNGGYPLVSAALKANIDPRRAERRKAGRPGADARSAERESGSDPDLFSAGAVS